MSGEKCARPSVHNDLLRRQAERQRAQQDAEAVLRRLAALCDQAQQMDCLVVHPPRPVPGDADTDALRALIEGGQAAIVQQEREIAKAEARFRIRLIQVQENWRRVSAEYAATGAALPEAPVPARATADWTELRACSDAFHAAVAEIERRLALSRFATAPQVSLNTPIEVPAQVPRAMADLQGQINALLADLGDLPPAEIRKISRAAEGLVQLEPRKALAELATLRARTRQAKAQAAQEASARAEAQDRIHELRGLAGADVEKARAALDAVIQGSATLTDALRSEVAAAIERGAAASEDAFIADVLGRALAQEGFRVPAGFDREFAAGRETRLPADRLAGHAMIVQRDGRTIRTLGVDAEGHPADAAADMALCEAIEQVYERMTAAGLPTRIVKAQPPGATARPSADGFVQPPRTAARTPQAQATPAQRKEGQ